MENDASDVTASHGGGHLDGSGGELGVVMLADGEPRQAPGSEVLDVR